MIIQLLGMAFILAFSAIAILGHVLLVLAVLIPILILSDRLLPSRVARWT
jgi:hypothetical protein